MKTIGVLGGLGRRRRWISRRSVDEIILGCTEIPLLLGDETNALDLVNPLDLLAHAVVTRALQP